MHNGNHKHFLITCLDPDFHLDRAMVVHSSADKRIARSKSNPLCYTVLLIRSLIINKMQPARSTRLNTARKSSPNARFLVQTRIEAHITSKLHVAFAKHERMLVSFET